MREAFAHDAVVAVAPDADEAAPGGALTVALCGSWSHEPPCPLAPHHTRADRSGSEVTLRVLFATEPSEESRVRGLIDETLARGWGDRPDGGRAEWRLLRTTASTVRPEEQEHAARLTRS